MTISDCQIIAGTLIRVITLDDFIIKECQLSGVFLDYDPSTNRYQQSPISKYLTQMEEAIQYINNNSQNGVFTRAHSDFLQLFQGGKAAPNDSITIDYLKIAPVLLEHDQVNNIVALSNVILKQLFSEESAEEPKLYPARLIDNFEVPENLRKLYEDFDEYYGRELTDIEIDKYVAELEGVQQ